MKKIKLFIISVFAILALVCLGTSVEAATASYVWNAGDGNASVFNFGSGTLSATSINATIDGETFTTSSKPNSSARTCTISVSGTYDVVLYLYNNNKARTITIGSSQTTLKQETAGVKLEGQIDSTNNKISISGDNVYWIRISLYEAGTGGSGTTDPTPVTYNVTFNSNGGSNVAAQTVQQNQTATQPTAPTKSGYTFDGWYTDSACTNAYNFSTPVTGNLTLYAKWVEIAKEKFTVTFESDGSVYTEQTVEDGSTVSKPVDPTRSGYTFAGWYTDSACNNAYNFSSKVENSFTLYAKWEAVVVEDDKLGVSVYYQINEETDTLQKGDQIRYIAVLTNVSEEDLKNLTAHWTFTLTKDSKNYTSNVEITTVYETITDVPQFSQKADGTYYAVYVIKNLLGSGSFDGFTINAKVTVDANESSVFGETTETATSNTYVIQEYTTPDIPEIEIPEVDASLPQIYKDIVQSGYVVLYDDFNSYASGQLDTWSGSWGTKGFYQHINVKNSEGDAANNYVSLGNGNAQMHDSTGGGTQIIIDYGTALTGGIVEGYLEATFENAANSWTSVQFISGSSTEVFGIRTDSNVLKYRINGASTYNTAETSISVANTTYKIHYIFNLDTQTLTMTINGSAFVTNLKIDGLSSVAGVKIVSSDSGNKMAHLDNFAVSYQNVDIDTYKANALAKLTNVYNGYDVANNYASTNMTSIYNTAVSAINACADKASVETTLTKAIVDLAKAAYTYDLSNYVNADDYTINASALASAISTGKNNISSASTIENVEKAYNDAIAAIDAIESDKAALETYKANAIETITTYKDSALYTYNLDSYNTIIENAKSAINASATTALVDQAVNTYKAQLDALKTDASVLAEKKQSAISELASYEAQLVSGLKDQVYINKIAQAEATGVANINAALTVTAVETALANAKSEMLVLYNSATQSITDLKQSAITELTNYANTYAGMYAEISSAINTAKNNGITAINKCTTNSAVVDALAAAKAEIDALVNELENSQQEGIVSNGEVKITAYGGLNEAAYVEFNNLSKASDYKVYIKGPNYSAYTKVDEKVAYTSTTSSGRRVDFTGLQAGTYNIKVVPVISGTETESSASICRVIVDAYDRSGYAHFNYTEGVGAYNDNGTLKDNAIVLYVTDSNKNTVTLTYGGQTIKGIGNILNTSGMDSGNGSNSKGGKANTNNDILKTLADNNIPLVVRFVGVVSNSGLYAQGTFTAANTPLIDGLSHYDSIDYGGSEGDNGHMARMKSAHDVTLEGVGAGATIDGWGFHFMCSTTDKDTQRGTSFEARNLIFINTPEDAIGMEGTQGILSSNGSVSGDSSTSSDILGSVERCWVHDNEFYCPSISGPAESDKAEGDGSVDFKRGQYFTCSYNYFEGCHKTNLVGSSDSSLQFNLTYHHNYWKNCGSRGPLARNANIHMYNNIFEGQTDYAMNPRATSYIFSEYNMFYKCKNPQDVSGGALKSFNDSFASIISNCNGTIVTSKDTPVSNSCKFQYRNIDYSRFELDSKLSYIPTNNYAFETDFTELRKDVVLNAGTQSRINKTAETLTESDWSVFSALGDVNPITISSLPYTAAPGKISKTIYAFTVNTSFTIEASFSGGVLVNAAGQALMTDGGTVSGLPAGTYGIQPTNFNCKAFAASDFKEITISSIKITQSGSGSGSGSGSTTDELANAKTSAINELVAYKDSALYTINKSAYDSAIANGKSAINSATSVSAVSSALAQAKKNIDAIENDATVLANAKSSAISQLNSKKNEYVTSLNQSGQTSAVTQINNVVTTATNNINSATSQSAITTYLNNALAEMQTIYNNSSVSISEYISVAKSELSTYANNKISIYPTLSSGINNIVSTYNTKLSSQTTKDGVDTVLAQAKAEIDSYIASNSGSTGGGTTSDGVTITLSGGDFETAYVEFNKVSGATSYNVSYKKSNASSYTQIDDMLIREYSNYIRADIPGISAGTYSVKVEAVKNGSVSGSATASNINVLAHDRSGYAFVNGSSSGAYNDDGTLKSNAKVVYITNGNKDSVTLDGFTGFNNIIAAMKKSITYPVAFRLIGNVNDPAAMDKGDILVDGITVGITIEGIGKDAVANGWGIRIKNSSNVEVRNLGLMNCDSSEGDSIGLQQSNNHCWIHNNDIFYGDAGSDADQAKGDGALDTKKSQYVTHSYNHFWDTGKTHLNGNGDTELNYITYHHNWYDHSDSRHPRVRVSSAIHVYNNLFDGVSKYGIGATLGSSIFVENNYFLDTKTPMMISKQGTDALGDGTFSGENGGMIKSYGNKFVFENTSLSLNYITHKDNATSFDAYEASSRNEQVPSSYKTLSGGTTYSNFDTASGFYSYNVETPDQAKTTVKTYAGRLQGGDFTWDFSAMSEDTNYDVISGLKSKLTSYQTSLVKILGSGETAGSGSSGSGSTGGDSGNTGGDSGNTGGDSGNTGGNTGGDVSGSGSYTYTTSSASGLYYGSGTSYTSGMSLTAGMPSSIKSKVLLIPVAAGASGTISITCGAAQSSRYAYLLDGSGAQTTTKAVMSKTAQTMSFTSANIITVNGVAYIGISTGDDFKPTQIVVTY